MTIMIDLIFKIQISKELLENSLWIFQWKKEIAVISIVGKLLNS